MLSSTTLSAQQAARLGSRQSMAPLPKELTKDGKSYMALAEYDSKGTRCQVGLYDSFGPSGVKLSFDIPLVKLSQSYYEKASGYSNRVSMETYTYVLDRERTYSSKSDIEAYLNRNIITLSEFTALDGKKAYCLSPEYFNYSPYNSFDSYYWEYSTYGTQYPNFFFAIDESGHLFEHYVYYWQDESDIKMGSNNIEAIDQGNTYSSKEDIEYYINNGATPVEVVEFTTLDGEQAYYIVGDYTSGTKAIIRVKGEEEESRFWNYEQYGTLYPYVFLYINSDGYLVVCNAEYYTERDFTNAVWTKDPDFSSNNDYYYYYEEENYYEPNIGAFLYMNVDDSFYPTTRVFVSQNLFNADDNWEYITFDIEFEPRDTSDAREYGDGEVRRKIYLKTIYKGIKIINDAGAQSFYITLPDEENEWTSDVSIQSVSVLNGLIYILTSEYVNKNNSNSDKGGNRYEGIYLIDPKDASVRAITRTLSRMNINSTVIDKGENLDIQISESGKNDNLTISSMSGQIINSSDISEENPVSVNTGAMPKGIYNVTLRGNGNPTENQRIIIK
jgi:hypothetical protein